MKVKWTALIDNASGGIDDRHYARSIPGNDEWAAVCNKPELSKKTRKKKAALPVAKNFTEVIETSKEILHNQERRAVWQAMFDADKRKAQKHNKPIQGRLCDYVRHHVSIRLKNGEPIP